MSTEDRYLPGVVHRELGWFTTGEEALKAQAVAARTYLLSYLNRKGPTAQLPSLGPSFQAWTGQFKAHDTSAVHGCKGQVMTYLGRVIYSNYVSGAWPLDADGNAHAASRYGYPISWTEIRNLWKQKVAGQISSSTWSSRVTKYNAWAWTEILTTRNEGKSGADVSPTLHNTANERNRGGLGQYRAYFLEKSKGYGYLRIVRYFYGDDITVTGTSAAPPPPPPSPSGPSLTAHRVTASVLNVRSGPGTGYRILGTVRSGQVYVSTQAASGWQKVYWRGGQGWTSGAYLSTVSGARAVRVKVNDLNVRTGPGTGYGVVGQIQQGQVYATAGTQSGWHRIAWDGSLDYSYGGYLEGITIP
jgi:uncharacterized protein YraI